MRRTPAIAVASLGLAGFLLTGCSSSGEANVFAGSGSTDGGLATTADIVDVGVPLGQNVSDHSVRLLRVTLVGMPASVRLRSVTAYPPGPGVGVMTGNLLTQCPADKPYPVSADVTPAHASVQWNAVLAITFSRPGTYVLSRLKVFYLSNGQRGWQYQDLNTTITVKSAPRGARSQFAGCLPPTYLPAKLQAGDR
jgi:hypothetical protein